MGLWHLRTTGGDDKHSPRGDSGIIPGFGLLLKIGESQSDISRNYDVAYLVSLFITRSVHGVMSHRSASST